MNRIVAETPRLILREMCSADAEPFFRLNADPEVIRYTGDTAFADIEAAKTFLSAYDHYRLYGFGRWALIHKEQQDFIGWCGLKFSPDKNEVDVGYRLFHSQWNKGFATEAALASIDLGFKQFNLPDIVGRCMKENSASIRVLEKCGLSFLREDTCGGEPGLVYRIVNRDQL